MPELGVRHESAREFRDDILSPPFIKNRAVAPIAKRKRGVEYPRSRWRRLPTHDTKAITYQWLFVQIDVLLRHADHRVKERSPASNGFKAINDKVRFFFIDTDTGSLLPCSIFSFEWCVYCSGLHSLGASRVLVVSFIISGKPLPPPQSGENEGNPASLVYPRASTVFNRSLRVQHVLTRC